MTWTEATEPNKHPTMIEGREPQGGDLSRWRGGRKSRRAPKVAHRHNILRGTSCGSSIYCGRRGRGPIDRRSETGHLLTTGSAHKHDSGECGGYPAPVRGGDRLAALIDAACFVVLVDRGELVARGFEGLAGPEKQNPRPVAAERGCFSKSAAAPTSPRGEAAKRKGVEPCAATARQGHAFRTPRFARFPEGLEATAQPS